MKPYHLQKFKLYLNDRTIIFHDVNITSTGHGVYIIGNPLTILIRPVRFIGVCAFDQDGILGRVIRLPSFVWKALRTTKAREDGRYGYRRQQKAQFVGDSRRNTFSAQQ